MTRARPPSDDETPPCAPTPEEAPTCIFDTPWWLNAASGGRMNVTLARRGERIAGLLATFPRRRLVFIKHHPPPYTRIMTPVVDPGEGSPETRRRRTVEIVGELLQGLGRSDSFRTVIRADPDLALAFSLNGCRISPLFTFVSDADVAMEAVLLGMNQKTRNLVRAGEAVARLRLDAEPASFIALSRVRRGRDVHEYRALRAIIDAARARGLCRVILATDAGGADLASAVVVWDRSRLYFLAGARVFSTDGNKAYAAVVHAAIGLAKSRGLAFDFDGYADAAHAHPLLRWGLRVEANFEVVRETRVYQALRLSTRGAA